MRTDWKAKKVATRNSNFSVTKERKCDSAIGLISQVLITIVGWCSSLKRTQRYLGLRATNDPRSTAGNGSITDESIFDYDSTQRYIFDLDVIFISLDIEADEMDTDLVTEIGLAALDTRDIRNVATGLSGETWIKMVTGKHFRIAERAHIRNHVYVEGNPLNFDERFGKSEIVPLSSIAAKVKACFEIRDTTLVESASREPNLRNIVLVGHNIKSDIKWLYKIDVDILNVNNLVEVLATEDLQKALKHDQRGGTSLARLLQEMEIDAWNLHNAVRYLPPFSPDAEY